MPCFANFEIDIISALSSQLIAAFEKLEPGSLSDTQLESLGPGQGVYQLLHQGELVYVGQARKIKVRLHQHRKKITGRKNIDVADMGFKCLFVHSNWTALAPEDALIKYHRKLGKGACPWNGNGFGPHDPGRERETTGKPTEGFDALYPIRDDWACASIKSGKYSAYELVNLLKSSLPYLLRFERKSADLLSVRVTVPGDGMAVKELVKLVAMNLPGWQATAFPGHMILYKEHRNYAHGTKIWPVD